MKLTLITSSVYTVWKSTQKHDHNFCETFEKFSVKMKYNCFYSQFTKQKPLLEIANSTFLGKFGPDFLLNTDRGRVELVNGVEKPDLDGYVQKLGAIENDQFLVRKNA